MRSMNLELVLKYVSCEQLVTVDRLDIGVPRNVLYVPWFYMRKLKIYLAIT